MIPAIVAAAAALILTACSDKEDEPTIAETSILVNNAKVHKRVWESRPDKTMAQIGPFDCYYEAQEYTAPAIEVLNGMALFWHLRVPEKDQFCEERLEQAETEIQKLFPENSLECSLKHSVKAASRLIGRDWYAHVELMCLAKR